MRTYLMNVENSITAPGGQQIYFEGEIFSSQQSWRILLIT